MAAAQSARQSAPGRWSIRSNLFVNFGSSAVEVSGMADNRHIPSGNATVEGNIFDMTHVGENPAARTAIQISADDVLVHDNQVYVRGEPDPLVTAIRLNEPAVNLMVHDNLIRNCGTGPGDRASPGGRGRGARSIHLPHLGQGRALSAASVASLPRLEPVLAKREQA